jgi:hypothetical protein
MQHQCNKRIAISTTPASFNEGNEVDSHNLGSLESSRKHSILLYLISGVGRRIITLHVMP